MYNDTQTAIEVIGFLVTVGAIIWRSAGDRKKAELTDTALNTKIDNLESKLSDKIDANSKVTDELKKTIGNGGYSGIKHEIETIKINCAANMAKVGEQITTLFKIENK